METAGEDKYEMGRCPVHVRALAYVCLVYTFASVMYLLRTRNIGTPFADSLTQEQIHIKQQSAARRLRVFGRACLEGAVMCLILRPFR